MHIRTSVERIIRNRIRKNLIQKNWEDMLLVAGSLKLGTVNATQ
ncbi:Tn3 family transposase [Shimazuella kribbensis]